MIKTVSLSVFLTLSLCNITHAKVIQCVDDKGNVYFTDSSCPVDVKEKKTPTDALPIASELTVNPGQQNTRKIEFYCNSGKEGFVRC